MCVVSKNARREHVGTTGACCACACVCAVSSVRAHTLDHLRALNAARSNAWMPCVCSRNVQGVFTGVRNYCARNYLRDRIAPGDTAFYYHSSCKVPAIVGIVEVTGRGVPDPSAADTAHPLYDAKHTPDAPRWFEIPIRAVRELQPPVTLAVLREHAAELEGLPLLRQPRLSVQPVTEEQWQTVLGLEAQLALSTCASAGAGSTSRSSGGKRAVPSRAKHSARDAARSNAKSEHMKAATESMVVGDTVASGVVSGSKRRRSSRAKDADLLACAALGGDDDAGSSLVSPRTRARTRKPGPELQ